MVYLVHSLGLHGITGYPVSVECDLSNGLPAFTVVGLPDAAVNEARERVRSAVKNCGFSFPVSRITVNLAPAHVKKIGTLYDLPILVGLLAAGQILFCRISWFLERPLQEDILVMLSLWQITRYLMPFTVMMTDLP